jgi:ABC-type transport system involved in multi-copper enzyme maturation permease subunit
MVFGLGPVLRYELITTARRGRYYLARSAYGSVLLVLLWGQFGAWEAGHPLGGTPEDLHRFSESTFIAFSQAQLVTLLCLLPALVAGVIADEHQRKTLHYLLASRLSSLEIVLGKLGARLLHVGTFVALGLPVVCLLALYGGLDPAKVFYIYFGTFTTVLAVAGPSIFISVLARRPRDAILAAYAIEALWLLGPPAIDPVARYLDGSLWWVWPVSNVLLLTNPLTFLDRITGPTWYGYRPGWDFLANWIPGLGPFEAMFWAMSGIQLLAGLIFLVLAIAGLRPLRGSSWPGAEPRRGWWTRLQAQAQAFARHRAAAAVARNELLASRIRRPACGDDPMLWKERYAALGCGLKWLGGRPVVLFCGVLLGCYLLDAAYPVVAATLRGQQTTLPLSEVNSSVRAATLALSVLGLLAIAASSAVAITGEREQDTWISLATTLLTPGEVVRAKQFGAVWGARRVALALLITWAMGILLGAIHPLAALLAAGLTAVAAWFAAAVGVSASALARNSTRALAWTFISLLLLLNFWPFSLSGTLSSPGEFAALWSDGSPPGAAPLALTPAALAIVCVIAVCYAAIATVLTTWSIHRLGTTWGRT